VTLSSVPVFSQQQGCNSIRNHRSLGRTVLLLCFAAFGAGPGLVSPQLWQSLQKIAHGHRKGITVNSLALAQETFQCTWTMTMSDKEILQTLLEQHGLQMNHCAGSYDSLLLAVIPQVSADDISRLPQRWAEAWHGGNATEQWQCMTPTERVRMLRRVSFLEESEFLSGLAHNQASLFNDWRTLELFKDMVEELVSTGRLGAKETPEPWNLTAVSAYVRKLARETPPALVHKFVLTNADASWWTARRRARWAATPEMAALSRAFGRPFVAYGHDPGVPGEVEMKAVGEHECELPYMNTFAPYSSLSATGKQPVLLFRDGKSCFHPLQPVCPADACRAVREQSARLRGLRQVFPGARSLQEAASARLQAARRIWQRARYW